MLWKAGCVIGVRLLQGEQALTQDLYREKGKQNPAEAGYTASNERACIAFPTDATHRSRTGPPVLVRAACMQVSHRGVMPHLSGGCMLDVANPMGLKLQMQNATTSA